MVERGWDRRMKDGNKKGRNWESGFTLGRRQVRDKGRHRLPEESALEEGTGTTTEYDGRKTSIISKLSRQSESEKLIEICSQIVKLISVNTLLKLIILKKSEQCALLV